MPKANIQKRYRLRSRDKKLSIFGSRAKMSKALGFDKLKKTPQNDLGRHRLLKVPPKTQNEEFGLLTHKLVILSQFVSNPKRAKSRINPAYHHIIEEFKEQFPNWLDWDNELDKLRQQVASIINQQP